MRKYDVEFELSFTGNESDNHAIDMYDVSQAILGFQRSLAITTHLVMNGNVITQAPSLSGAKIYTFPSEEGSWKVTAGIIATLATGAYHVTTAPKDTPLGHLMSSAYDYVISQSLGFHVDYDKTLGVLYEEAQAKNIKPIREGQLDSVIEKCSTAIRDLHRPIYKNQTAEEAKIYCKLGDQRTPLKPTLSIDTFGYITEEYTSDELIKIEGLVSSYSSNTFKGRIYVAEEERSIPFILNEDIRGEEVIRNMVDSLRANALRKFKVQPYYVYCLAHKVTSKNGRLKSYKIIDVSDTPIE